MGGGGGRVNTDWYNKPWGMEGKMTGRPCQQNMGMVEVISFLAAVALTCIDCWEPNPITGIVRSAVV
jgi:hypothetical protein